MSQSIRPTAHSKKRRMRLPLLAIAMVMMAQAAIAAEDKGKQTFPLPQAPATPDIGQICMLIALHADNYGLPREFFARLIWKESRFDHQAVSPVGAEGIAQFMPGTAKERGLADPFDVAQALPASARLLKDLRGTFGNWGLAAAAYNAGPTRVARWISSGGFLPLETEDYVLDITGRPADDFTTGIEIDNRPLDPALEFDAACRKLPVIRSTTIAMASVHVKPWGIQVAGNFRRSAAIRQWQKISARFPKILADHEPVVSRQRTPIGRRGIYAVRIGADSRKEANTICTSLRSAGGACIVTRNR